MNDNSPYQGIRSFGSDLILDLLLERFMTWSLTRHDRSSDRGNFFSLWVTNQPNATLYCWPLWIQRLHLYRLEATDVVEVKSLPELRNLRLVQLCLVGYLFSG